MLGVEVPDGKKFDNVCLADSTQYGRVTDGQTDGRTDILPRHTPRLCSAEHRALKIKLLFVVTKHSA